MAKELISAGLKMTMDETELTGLLSTPDLGQGEKEKLEVTDLSDTSRRYINGLADTPDSWEFEFQYQSASDSAFYLLKQAMDDGEVHQFAIQFTDGLKFAFGAYVNVMLNGASVGESLKFKARELAF